MEVSVAGGGHGRPLFSSCPRGEAWSRARAPALKSQSCRGGGLRPFPGLPLARERGREEDDLGPVHADENPVVVFVRSLINAHRSPPLLSMRTPVGPEDFEPFQRRGKGLRLRLREGPPSAAFWSSCSSRLRPSTFQPMGRLSRHTDARGASTADGDLRERLRPVSEYDFLSELPAALGLSIHRPAGIDPIASRLVFPSLSLGAEGVGLSDGVLQLGPVRPLQQHGSRSPRIGGSTSSGTTAPFPVTARS